MTSKKKNDALIREVLMNINNLTVPFDLPDDVFMIKPRYNGRLDAISEVIRYSVFLNNLILYTAMHEDKPVLNKKNPSIIDGYCIKKCLKSPF